MSTTIPSTSTLEIPPVAELRSPGKAFSRQARTEMLLTRLVEKAAKSFLADVRRDALRDKLAFSPMAVTRSWEEAMSEALANPALSADAVAYMYDALMESDIPDEAYSSAWAVIQAYAGNQWSVQTLEEQLNEALSTDTGSVSQQALVAAGFWAGLKETGSRWVTRIRLTVRTAATGLDGRLTLAGLRFHDVPSKTWVSRHDDQVRPTHLAADGQTVPRESPFHVGNAWLQYPGERSAAFEEIVNCRCVMIASGEPASTSAATTSPSTTTSPPLF